ncbi:hypothetical protein SARC_13703, partial [Sphaeroforma arctica JP610]
YTATSIEATNTQPGTPAKSTRGCAARVGDGDDNRVTTLVNHCTRLINTVVFVNYLRDLLNTPKGDVATAETERGELRCVQPRATAAIFNANVRREFGIGLQFKTVYEMCAADYAAINENVARHTVNVLADLAECTDVDAIPGAMDAVIQQCILHPSNAYTGSKIKTMAVQRYTAYLTNTQLMPPPLEYPLAMTDEHHRLDTILTVIAVETVESDDEDEDEASSILKCNVTPSVVRNNMYLWYTNHWHMSDGDDNGDGDDDGEASVDLFDKATVRNIQSLHSKI